MRYKYLKQYRFKKIKSSFYQSNCIIKLKALFLNFRINSFFDKKIKVNCYHGYRKQSKMLPIIFVNVDFFCGQANHSTVNTQSLVLLKTLNSIIHVEKIIAKDF